VPCSWMRVLFYCLAMPEIAPVSQSVSKGWRALSRGSWKEARAIFEQELEVGESATALEGLSWAAWWLDDADMVFGARERAYRLYRKGQDPASAARMATWLAADHLDSTALWLWRAVGCGGRGACWSRWSLGLIMAGSPSTRATSPACAATL
jgi:hypothetical protein